MYRQSGTIPVTASKAILALYHEYADEYAAEPEHLMELIELAYSPEGARSDNRVVRSIRLLRRLGLAQPALLDAVQDLNRVHAFNPVHDDPEKVPNPHRNEVVSSEWNYPLKWRPLSVHEKAENIGRFFFADKAREFLKYSLSTEQEDDFSHVVAIKPTVLARWFNIRDPYSPDGYAEMLAKLSRRVASAYRMHRSGFDFYRTLFDFELRRKKIRITMLNSTKGAIRRIERQTESPLMVFPGQLGMRWRGSSIERVAWMSENKETDIGHQWQEFLLPAYVIFFELMADPSRLCHQGTLAMYCGGDVVTDVSHFHRSGLSLGFGSDNLHVLRASRTRADEYYGVTTGLVREF